MGTRMTQIERIFAEEYKKGLAENAEIAEKSTGLGNTDDAD